MVGGGLCRHYRQLETEGLTARTSALYQGICRGERAALGTIFQKIFEKHFMKNISARGITLIESTERRSAAQSRLLVNRLLSHNKNRPSQSFRYTGVGLVGVQSSDLI